jgi:predicted permease
MRFAFWRRKQRDEDLNEEIQAHLTLAEREEMESGHTRENAQFAAQQEFGNVTHAAEVTREMWGWRWIEDFFQDARYAVRTLRQKPGFVFVALLTLALGTGATTVMFTVVNGVLLKPLPYAEPDRLVRLEEKTEKSNQFGNIWAFAYPNFLDCQRQSQTLDIAAWVFGGGALREPDKAEFVNGREVSENFFSVLGVPLFRGRSFSPDEDRLNGPPVTIISYELWQRYFGESANAIGAPLVLDGKSYSVVGILPKGFQLLGTSMLDVFTPIGQDASSAFQRRDRHPGISVVARVKPGVMAAQAQTELGVIGRQLAKQYPESNDGRSFIAIPFQVDVGDARPTLWLLLGAVSLVLLVACANVANLLLARSVSREREFAMRAALGASRGRLARQCLTESAVLGVAGGTLGVLLAAASIRPFVTFWPGGLPRADEIHLDWRVLLFALGISILTGLFFGLAPALRVPSRNLEQRLRSGARSIAGHSRRLHGSFVISEIALAVILLVSAGILGRTLLRLASLNPGVNVHGVLTARMALGAATLANPAQILPAWQDVLDHARRVPGIESAALVDTVPMREGNNEVGYFTSAALPPQDQMPLALATCVSPDYLTVVGLPLLRGRFISDHDRQGSEPVVVIDNVLAKLAFGDADPLDKRLWIPDTGSPFSVGGTGADVARVIGVVGHVRHWGPAGDDDAKVRAQFYYPFAQVAGPLLHRWSNLMSIMVRTTVSPLSVVDPLEKEIRGATGDQVLTEVLSLDQIATATLDQQRSLMLLFGIFAGLALLLACIGIYGVVAYLTGQRVPEIGVRMALGASPWDVIMLVLRQSLGMILAGVAAGAAGALIAAGLLERFVAGVRSFEPLTFAAMVTLLMFAALVASFVPARRASRVDPLKALRHE